MKKISKKKLQKLIMMTREYWSAEELDRELLIVRINRADALAKECGVSWSNILYLLDSILATNGFDRDADDNKVYWILASLGWEVYDEDETI